MTTLQHGQEPRVGTPNEKAVLGACNTQTASETTANARIFAPAQKANNSDLASRINAAHKQAIAHADKAIDFAKQAGDLLLEVKADLRHGEFLPWIQNNLDVTPRQAQRYMAAALGKPLPISAIKNDTVSHLENAESMNFRGVPANSWLHRVHELGLTSKKGVLLYAGNLEVFVEPSHTKGSYYAFTLDISKFVVHHFGHPFSLSGVAIALDIFKAEKSCFYPNIREGDSGKWLWESLIRTRHSEEHYAAVRNMGLML
jgi:hypothetical protein